MLDRGKSGSEGSIEYEYRFAEYEYRFAEYEYRFAVTTRYRGRSLVHF